MKIAKYIMLITIVIILIFNTVGCSVIPVKCKPADDTLYKKYTYKCPDCKQIIKNEKRAWWLSILPGFGVWYATDDFFKGLVTFASSLIILPYFLSFKNAEKLAHCRNLKASIDYYERVYNETIYKEE